MTTSTADERSVASASTWRRCEHCGTLQYTKKLARRRGVCLDCEHHHRLTAPERIEQLLDEATFRPLNVEVVSNDVLGFTDTQPYAARLAKARNATGMSDAASCGTGAINGAAVCLAVMDFRFMGGSLGVAVGEMITRTAETALRRRLPLIIVTASGGARMQEGALALMQMAKVSQALAELRDAGLLTVGLVTDPTFGGVAASFATNCDVTVVEQGARMGFAGRRVIEQTIRQELPDDFQTARFLLERGQVDSVVHRGELRAWLTGLLLATGPREEQPCPAGEHHVVGNPDELTAADPTDSVRRARDVKRPTTLDYINLITDRFVELHGDRTIGDCPAMVAGFGTVSGVPVAIVGHQKGHQTNELVARNFGMPQPEGYRKALRVMKLAEQLGIAIVSLVDTPGAYPGREAEEHGQAGVISQNIMEMLCLRTPILSIVTGEGGSGGALALAVADQVLMLENSIYSVISPEGCSSILWGDSQSAETAARALRITARELLSLRIVDGVLPEPPGGAQDAPVEMAERLRSTISSLVDDLSRHGGQELVESRRKRFREFGSSGLLVSELTEGAVV